MKLLFVGDVMLGRLVNQILKEKSPQYPWGNTLDIFSQADFRFCNLECTLSDRGIPWSSYPKAFHFRSDAANIAVLKAADINCVSLANNHILDFEYEAMFDTLNILDEAGIHRAGAGADFSGASSAAIFEINGIKTGFISFTDNEPDWAAGEKLPGIFYTPVDIEDERANFLFKKIAEIKNEADLLIIAAHWGPNWGDKPQPIHIPFAHRLIDEGADIIFGHSPHVFRGIEIYNKRPILYSVGNFIDDYAVDEIERNDRSFIFIIEVQNSKITRLLLKPTIIYKFQARLAEGMETQAIAAKMRQLCKGFGTLAVWNEENGFLEIDI